MRKILNLAIFLFLMAKSFAHEPYQATVAFGPFHVTFSDPNLVDLERSLKNSNLQKLLPFYTPSTPVSLEIDLRGIIADAAFPAGSSALVVSIPQAGTTQVFNGGTRDDSITLFKDFIRDGGSHNQRLFKAYAKYSPIDPIAGNPNSLMAQMGQADYLLGHLSPLSGCDCAWNSQPIVNQVQIGAEVTRGFSHGFDTTAVTLPLRYSYSPTLDWAFIIDAPVTYFRNGGASSIFTSLGVGFRYPITYSWSLTPILRFGSGGSLDLCTAGTFFSAGITSVYNLKISNFVFSMTNYASYITSTNFWLTGINLNYHLQNYIIKNGLSITTCHGFCVLDRPTNISLSFIDSYFTKQRLFIRHYDEVELFLITNYINPCILYDSLSLGFAYQWGQKNYKGYRFDMIYQF